MNGIIYLMTTAVPGLIKIGKTGSGNYEQRMYNLEQNGYRNVTGLKREFAIEVYDYDEKEALLDTIFAKSRLADTELFAVDINIVKSLLSSFDGKMIYPKEETKEEVFAIASDNTKSKLIPDGRYTFTKKKKSDFNNIVNATAYVENGCWTLLKGSVLGVNEDKGVSQTVREMRKGLPLGVGGLLLEDAELGACSPSFAGCVVMNQSINGWTDWNDQSGEAIDKYRVKKEEK